MEFRASIGSQSFLYPKVHLKHFVKIAKNLFSFLIFGLTCTESECQSGWIFFNHKVVSLKYLVVSIYDDRSELQTCMRQNVTYIITYKSIPWGSKEVISKTNPNCILQTFNHDWQLTLVTFRDISIIYIVC